MWKMMGTEELHKLPLLLAGMMDIVVASCCCYHHFVGTITVVGLSAVEDDGD
jgi:hypothetical protein